jgi:eukaryotic-like serine/threonine-protein kinase
MGEVFLAEDRWRGGQVAIKCAADPAASRSARLLREARLAARLAHRAIVRVLDYGSGGAGDYIVMELVDGPSLRGLLAHGPLDPSAVVAVAREVALGLDHAHERGVVHRDIKLENVLVSRDGQPKISDFGIAAEAAPPSERRAAAAGDLDASDLLGTPRTMSPEQIQGGAIDARSDLFSLGVMLYELLAGTSPFAADSETVTRLRVLCDEPRPIGDVVAGLAPEVAALVTDLLEKSPGRRPQTARDVLARLPAPHAARGA